MFSVFMISRRRLATLVLAPAALFLIEASCNRVPLLAPSGSTITLTTATSVLPINGSATIIAQVVESAGTAPQAGTHVTFTTSLGTIQPSDVSTDTSGRATVTFTSDSSGTATIAAISGGASTGTNPLKILVGTAAVQKVVVNASPATVPSAGGTTTISATVFDVNGNLMSGVPVTFTTTAGTLSSGVVTTTASGVASATLTTAQTATVTASVGVGGSTSTTPTTPTTGTTPTTPTTPSASGTASASVVVNVAAAPTIVITPPATVSAGLPATFTIAVTVPAANGSAIKSVTVDWGDGNINELGAVTGNAVVTHVFADTKAYLVKATAVDASGNSVTVSTVVNPIPVPHPGISIQATAGTAGSKKVTFTITITVPTGLNIQKVEIDYDSSGNFTSLGGAPSGSITTSNTYATAGDKTVKVRVTDSSGGITEASTVVTAP
jgi:adhesin/invasin